MALLQSFRPIAESPQDDEWKAALEIVGRLGGHALGVEVVAVYLRENPQVTYRAFAEGLERDGIELMDTTAGPEARDRLAWHTETCIRRLLEPTLASLSPSPADLRAVEYAALLPPDNVPLPWLRDLLTAEFPERTHPILGDPVAKVFQRLERLRLVVSQARGREPGAGQAATGDARLARMHRLVQDVVRARLGADDLASREVVVHQLAYSRAGWIKAHWGQVDLAWELRPLRDIALRLIARGDRQGYLMATASPPRWLTPAACSTRATSGGVPRTFSLGCRTRPPRTPTTRATSPSATTSSVTWRCPVAIRRRPGGTTRTA